jgi:hypothetical protein
MAITVSNISENHRGLAYSYTGDGSTTQTTVKHTRYLRNMHTAKAFVVTGATKFSTRSERGGLRAAEDGTAVTATVAIDAQGNCVVTTTPAVGNGLVASVVIVHDSPTA